MFRSQNSDAAISYRVIEVATSKISFADEVALGGRYPLSAVTNYLAEAAGINILNSFFPGSMAMKQPPKQSKTTIKNVKKFATESMNKLKEESKNDW